MKTIKKYIAKYDHNVFKPRNIYVRQQQEKYSIEIMAFNINSCKDIMKRMYNLNPFYMKIYTLIEYKAYLKQTL